MAFISIKITNTTHLLFRGGGFIPNPTPLGNQDTGWNMTIKVEILVELWRLKSHFCWTVTIQVQIMAPAARPYDHDHESP